MQYSTSCPAMSRIEALMNEYYTINILITTITLSFVVVHQFFKSFDLSRKAAALVACTCTCSKQNERCQMPYAMRHAPCLLRFLLPGTLYCTHTHMTGSLGAIYRKKLSTGTGTG